MKRGVFCVWLVIFGCFLPSLEGSSLSKYKKDLRLAIRRNSISLAKSTLKHLVGMDNKAAFRLIVKYLRRVPSQQEKMYWLLVNAAASFHSEAVLKELARFILAKKNSGFARDLVFALSQNPSTTTVIVLREVLKRGKYDLRLMAADQLSNIREASAVDALLEGWRVIAKKGEGYRTLRGYILRALLAITGQSLGDRLELWQSWWKVNRGRDWKGGEASGGKGGFRVGTVVGRLGGNRGSLFGSLKRLGSKRIVVIVGKCRRAGEDHNYDHIERTLERLEIPHTVVTKKDFAHYDLKGVMAIILNCTLSWEHCICPNCKATGPTQNRLRTCGGCDKHEIVVDRLTEGDVARIKAFVEGGGYLFTEDWGLVELVQRAWPKRIVKAGKTTQEDTVSISVSRGRSSHPYLRGIFGYRKKSSSSDSGVGRRGGHTVLRGVEEALEKVHHSWKVDAESPLIKIVNPYGVIPLLVSEELAKKYRGNGSVAVTFEVGRGKRKRYPGEIADMRGGRVLHVISHFGKQKSEDDEYTLQNLLVNFLLEAKSRWDLRHRH